MTNATAKELADGALRLGVTAGPLKVVTYERFPRYSNGRTL